MNWMPSNILVFGIVLLFVGGILAMKGVVREDANTVHASHLPVRVTLRRSLPRRGVCPVGIALIVAGVLCIAASYFMRL
jgi:hypothetical protein